MNTSKDGDTHNLLDWHLTELFDMDKEKKYMCELGIVMMIFIITPFKMMIPFTTPLLLHEAKHPKRLHAQLRPSTTPHSMQDEDLYVPSVINNSEVELELDLNEI